jgi:hypothetical protein
MIFRVFTVLFFLLHFTGGYLAVDIHEALFHNHKEYNQGIRVSYQGAHLHEQCPAHVSQGDAQVSVSLFKTILPSFSVESSYSGIVSADILYIFIHSLLPRAPPHSV